LVWVPGHSNIEGNSLADQLAREGASSPYYGPEPAIGLSKATIREHLKNWTSRKHKLFWGRVHGLITSKSHIPEPCTKRTKELLSLSRSKLRVVTGLLTGHAAVKDRLITMNLYNGDPSCRLCNGEPETVTHILYDCGALDRRRQLIFGQPKIDQAIIRNHPGKALYDLVQGTKVLEWIS